MARTQKRSESLVPVESATMMMPLAVEGSMRLICGQGLLSEMVGLVCKAVSTKVVMPILANILIEMDPTHGEVVLKGFDLEMLIEVKFEAKISGAGRSTLPAKLVMDIVAKMPKGEEVSIEITDEQKIIIECGSSHFELQGAGAAEYPKLPQPESTETLSIEKGVLLKAIQRTLFGVSQDENKQQLSGLSIKNADGGMEFVGTDGHRMCFERDNKNRPGECSVVVPHRSLKELEKLLGAQAQSGTAVKIVLDQKFVVFECDQVKLSSRILGGRYPDYKSLLPKIFALEVSVDRKQFIASLNRIEVLAEQKNNIVKVELRTRSQVLVISVEAADIGKGKEVVEAEFEGQDTTIAFNVHYLLDGLKAMDSEKVVLCLNSSTGPAVLKPVLQTGDESEYVYLIMPVSLR